MISFSIVLTLIAISTVVQGGPPSNVRQRRADKPDSAALASAVSEKERQALLKDRDFVYDFNLTVPTANNITGKVAFANSESYPALIGHDIAMIVGIVQPCGLVQPHTHPRADELVLAVKGTFETGLYQEDGARLILNTLTAGQVVVFPKGSIHYAQNAGCESAYFVASFNSADPGVQVTADGLFYGLPAEIVSASVGGGLDTNQINDIKSKLPKIPADGIESCRRRCGLV